ncbi:MAG: gamma-glutamyl-gamma-aminobutyrate hydrolase family protein [Acidobacteria bacterium]|nr:gamma-glutamyl-gamma-aminobutyrate hydrolase family protein [Acidobacteriota bacterium]
MAHGPTIGVAFPREDYIAALEQAGAVVRVLDPDVDALPGVLDTLDGVMLTGGPDVRPSLYGATTEHPTVDVDPVRDAYELPLARAAFERGLPLLAICRGLQVLNVAAGGTLIQDVPSAHPSEITHSLLDPRNAVAHDISVVPGSRLATAMADRLTPGGRLEVNSRHHQAIDRLAEGFTVVALAPDGIIEAVEPTRPGFCISVQWHPENFYRTGEFSALFTAFVDAARSNTATHST